jgi:DNA-binding NtrC family response regulator
MPYLAGSGGSTVTRVFEYYVWYTEEVAPMQLRNLSEILVQSPVQNAMLRFPIRSLVLSEDAGLKLLKQNLEDLRGMEKDGLIKHLQFLGLTTKRYVLRDRYLERYMGVPTFKHPLEARNIGFSIEKAIDMEAQMAEKLPSITGELGISFNIIDTSFYNEQSLRDRIYDYIAPDRPLLIDQDDIVVMRQMKTRVRLFAETPFTDICLIAGEAGTGKKMIAQAIHTATLEAKREEGFQGEFHVVDCELLKEIYLEDLRSVQDGTLFFDNIERLGERDPRVRKSLQEWLKAKVAGKHLQWNKMRIIAAGNLHREDLLGKRELRDISPLFRMSIDTPTLKEQGSTEIAKYIRFILNEIEQQENLKIEIEEAAQAYLENYEWPENITRLREVLERSMRNSWALGEDEKQWAPRPKPSSVVVQRNHIPREKLPRRILPEEPGEFLVVPENYEAFKQKKKELEGMLKEKFVKRFEHDFYQAELEKVVGGKPELAKRLGVSAQNLYRKLNELGIRE